MAPSSTKFVLLVFCLFIATAIAVRKSKFKLTSRIVNGLNATQGQFPYYAFMIEKNGTKYCGGAVISRWHILTAAHCVNSYKSNTSAFEVRLGKHVAAFEDDILVRVEKIVVHPSYVEEFLHNDIALLKMVDEIEFSTSVQPIALARSNAASEVGQKAILCGFGATSYYPPRRPPKVLQYHETEIHPMDFCKVKFDSISLLGDWKNWKTLTNLMKSEKILCVMDVSEVNSDDCYGDSGSPLVFNNTLIGVYSAGYGCALGYPNILANVYEHRDWITSEMRNTISV